ncbi:MAG TPA: hypothetical protein PKZ12_01925, partial [Smithellaceae bacterium]|nr:hypothetical protein [Smithellaceae bacterium]
MANIIGLKDIDDAIADLNYKNETTLKYRLVQAVRSFYEDDESLESVKSIDVEELVKRVWETGDDQELIKIKRKSFSSTKSSVNNDFKKLYQSGKNQAGIIIGQRNIFDISDEAKDKALAGIADVLKEKGIENIGGMAEILAAVNETVKKIFAGKDSGFGQEEIDRIKNLINDISMKVSAPLEKAGEKEKKEDTADETIPSVAGEDIENISGTAGQLAEEKAKLEKALASAGTEEGQREIERIKKLIGDICGKMGLTVSEIALPVETGDKERIGEKEGEAKETGEAEAYLGEREEILAKIDEARKALEIMGAGLGDSAEYNKIKILLNDISGKIGRGEKGETGAVAVEGEGEGGDEAGTGAKEAGEAEAYLRERETILAKIDEARKALEIMGAGLGDSAEYKRIKTLLDEISGQTGQAEEGKAAGELAEEIVEVVEEIAGD